MGTMFLIVKCVAYVEAVYNSHYEDLQLNQVLKPVLIFSSYRAKKAGLNQTRSVNKSLKSRVSKVMSRLSFRFKIKLQMSPIDVLTFDWVMEAIVAFWN